MAIQSVSFTNHKKKNSPMKDVFQVALKGGIAASIAYGAGKYLIPVSDEFAKNALDASLLDSFIQHETTQKRPRKSKKISADDSAHKTKVRTPKAKTNIYYNFKKMTEEQWAKFKEAFDKYVAKQVAQSGGEEACLKQTKNMLKGTIGKGLAVLLGGVFVVAGLLDLCFRPSKRADKKA